MVVQGEAAAAAEAAADFHGEAALAGQAEAALAVKSSRSGLKRVTTPFVFPVRSRKRRGMSEFQTIPR